MAFPTDTSASDVWSLKDQYIAKGGDNWPSLSAPILDYLIVAGGGGGGSNGGGGGAGGYLYSTSQELSTGTYIVTVGAGGTGGPSTGDAARGANGNDSEFNSETAIGGGGGGGGNTASLSTYNSGRDGGSGGGGAAWYGYGTGGSGTAGQGNSGGGGYDGGSPYPHGGGGGAGAAGAAGNAVVGYGGDGGDGLQNPITGTATYYAGGGGGGTSLSATNVGSGGLGGGGNAVSGDGSVNTGGGGGGGSSASGSTREGGDGGSGVVILRTTSTASTTTGSPTLSADGSYNIYTFTGSGSITFGGQPNTFDEAAELGTPTRIITSIPSTFGPDNSGQQKYTYAVDISSFDSTNNGILFELGGGTVGTSFQMNSGSLYVLSSGLSDTITSMSAFDGKSGTLYISIDYANNLYDIYWFDSVGGFTLIVSGTISADYVGTDTSGVGQQGGTGIYGANYGTYAGTITEWRSWAGTYYDFS